MVVGIDESTGLVYEGPSFPFSGIWPSPVLTQATFIASEADWSKLPLSLSNHPMSPMFREDSFDPVTRIRRGRVYQPWGNGQPSTHNVQPHPAYAEELGHQNHQGQFSKRLYTYSPAYGLLTMPKRGIGTTIALGNSKASTAWKIVDTEALASEDVMVTLKARSVFGVLPELDEAILPTPGRVQIIAAFNRLADCAFRESPRSVVDRSRDAAQVLLGYWIASNGGPVDAPKLDLGPLVKWLSEQERPRQVTKSAADIVRLLHARGKPNEELSRGLAPPGERDAEAAVALVGLLVRELGWGLQ